MSQEREIQSSPAPVELHRWYQIWIAAVTRPSIETFEEIAQDPRASVSRAFFWMFLATAVGNIVGAIALSGVFGVFAPLGGVETLGEIVALMAVGGIMWACLGAAFTLLSPLWFAIRVGVRHRVASSLGGAGSYEQMAYTFAAYSAPMSLLFYVAYASQCGGFLLPIIALYRIVLDIVAIRAAHEIGTKQALITEAAGIFLWLLIVGLTIGIGVLWILSASGPTIGEVFRKS